MSRNAENIPGISPLYGRAAEYFLVTYLQSRGLLRSDAVALRGRTKPRYTSDEELWNDVFQKKRIYSSQRLFLEEFTLLEWVPQSPGQYHTREGIAARDRAWNFVSERKEGRVIFDPSGKAAMVLGGIGCLRIAPKDLGGEQLRFLCAAKSGVAHKGFVVAMGTETYSKVAELIETKGGATCDISGHIRYWPADGSLPFHSAVGVPRMYLLVEDIELVGAGRVAKGSLDVTAAVTFHGEVEGNRDTYFTYSHFDPTSPDTLAECADWMRVNYVEKRYGGKVLTDFDELVPHFSDAAFPVKVLMNPSLPTDLISRISKDNFGVTNVAKLNIFVKKLQLKESPVSNITVKGNGNVIGNNNVVVTKINKGLAGNDLRELGEAFALLRGEVLQLGTIPEKIKKRSLRAIEDAEEEVADKHPDSTTIEHSLQRAKEVLETAGETYDKAKGWGKRLYDLGTTLVKFVPAAAAWVSKLLG